MDNAAYKAAVGRKIRRARQAGGVSVERFAMMVGIDRNYLRDVEYGRANPTVDILVRIADGLGCKVWELMDPGK